MAKSHVKWVKIELGDETFTYEIGMTVNGMVISRIVIISDNVEKKNVIYAQDRLGNTIFQANHVTYHAEHEL